MAEDSSPPEGTSGAVGRDIGQILLVIAIVAGLLASAALLPLLPGAGLPGLGLGSDGVGANGSAILPTPVTTASRPATTPPTDSATNGRGPGLSTNMAAGGWIGPGSETGVGGPAPIDALDSSLILTVESERAAYWRADAFRSYTGRTWEKPTETTALADAGVTDAGRTVDGDRLIQTVRLERPNRVLFAAWQPESVTGPDSVQVRSTATGGLLADQTLSAGTTYSVLSYRPPTSPERLRAVAGPVPADVNEPYTALPEETPARLTERVDDIVAGADTDYDKATAIEAWLESSKTYSLTASHPKSVEHVADHFVFEMERGYCEYFASAMAVMLRTQDIPARYVVGYATGEQVGEDGYQVRGYNAHAWVEVYFPEVGWVPFDPTPAAHLGPELQERAQNDTTYQALPDLYTVELNRTAVPGAPVTVTVRQGFRTANGVGVRFNGRTVGTTDASGNVTAVVPYSRNLSISLDTRNRSGAVGGPSGSAVEFNPSMTAPTARQLAPQPQATQAWNVTVPANVTFELDGPPLAGTTVVVTAAIEGHPMRQALVRTNGSVYGRTNATGAIELSLPDDPGRAIDLEVRRNEIVGRTTITVRSATAAAPPLEVAVESAWPLALPGTPATVAVSTNGSPVDGAVVTIDNRTVGRTTNGTLQATLPLAGQATVTARLDDSTGSDTVTGLYRNLGMLALLLGIGVVGAGLLWSRMDPTTGGPTTGLLAALIGLIRAGTNKLVVGALRLWTLWSRLRAELTALLDEGVAGLRDRLDTITGAVRRLSVASLIAWLSGVLAWIRSLLDRSAATSADETGAASTGPDRASRGAIRDAWARLLTQVQPPNPHHRTPGEIARYAVATGHDETAVMTVTNAYRDLVYGPHDPSSGVRESVEGAIEDVATPPSEPTGGEED